MPLYEYRCQRHGLFEEFNTIDSCRQGMACPKCSMDAPRVLSAPHLSLMDAGQRKAHERNDKSRHEPHVHTSSCGCGASKKRDKKPQVSKGRPWVLEHG